jgi:hypothetical protein
MCGICGDAVSCTMTSSAVDLPCGGDFVRFTSRCYRDSSLRH